MRHDFNRFFVLRGAVNNGFRAPALAEKSYSSISVLPTGASGLLPVNAVAARELGSRPLKPERSTNFSAVFILNPIRSMRVTVDGYQSALRDRIVSGGVYNARRAIDALAPQGITVASSAIANNVTAEYLAAFRYLGALQCDYDLQLLGIN